MAGHSSLAEVAELTARDAFARLPGDHRESLMLIAYNLASVRIRQGRHLDALRELDEGDALRDALGITASIEVASALITRGNALHGAGRCPPAIAAFDRGIALARSLAPERLEGVLGVQARLRCQFAVRPLREGIATLEDTLAHLPPGTPLWLRGNLLLDLGDVLRQTDHHSFRSLMLMLASIGTLREAGAPASDLQPLFDALKAWP